MSAMVGFVGTCRFMVHEGTSVAGKVRSGPWIRVKSPAESFPYDRTTSDFSTVANFPKRTADRSPKPSLCQTDRSELLSGWQLPWFRGTTNPLDIMRWRALLLGPWEELPGAAFPISHFPLQPNPPNPRIPPQESQNTL